MKYLWLSALLFSQSVLAWCPDENQHITLQGKLVQHTYPGPPNFESIEEGDEALTYDFLLLNEPLECNITSADEQVPEVQLIFIDKTKVTYADIAPSLDKEVIVTGETQYLQSGWHFTSVLLLLDDVKEVSGATTPEQKKSMLVQLQQFQQALREKDVAALKTYFVFPVEGDTWGFFPHIDSQEPEKLTEAVFDKNATKVIDSLQMLSEIMVNPDVQTLGERRINALSEEEQKRHYFPAEDDGMFFYEENGQKHTVEGTCDTVAGGEFEEGSLRLYLGTSANKQLPGLSEYCDGASSYIFKLIDGKLRLVGSVTVG